MGLVKFRKNMTYEEYAALPEKDEDTLYFIIANGRQRIYLGDAPYGGIDLDVTDSYNIALSYDGGILTAVAKIAEKEGNSLELKDDGLYAPPASVQYIDSPENGDLVTAAPDSIEDSRIAIVDELTAESSNWMAPSLAAVYNAISKVAPVWNSETASDDIFPENEFPDTEAIEPHAWLSYDLDMIETVPGSFVIKGVSSFCFDGETIMFTLSFDVTSVPSYSGSEGSPYVLDKGYLFKIPDELAPKTELYIPFSAYHQHSDGSAASWVCGCLFLNSTGNVDLSHEISFGYAEPLDFKVILACSASYSHWLAR
jgi:hypothetical protein